MIRTTVSAVCVALLASFLPAAPSPAAPAAPNSETAYVPDELLVRFKGGVSESSVRKTIHKQRASAERVITNDGLIQVKLPPGFTVPDVIDTWNALPDVEYAAPNLYARAFAVPNDSLVNTFDLGWNLRSVGAYDAWDVVTGEPRVVLAIIDSGVAFEDHPVPDYEKSHIAPGITMYRQSPELPGPFLPGYDFINDDEHPNDDSGHGTAVATIAAGAANNHVGSAGIAFGVTILPIKVLSDSLTGTMATIVQGIRFAADHGANIANLSLGFESKWRLRQDGGTPDSLAHAFRPLEEAIRYAQRRGVIVVAAAGNHETGDSVLSQPASYPGVISVAATGVTDSITDYSDHGHGLSFAAPGGDFAERNGDHIQDLIPVLIIKRRFSAGSLANPDSFRIDYVRGTSFAAPHVSGAVALLMSLGVKDQGSIEQILRATAVQPWEKANAYNTLYGFGLIQIDKAVQLAAARSRPTSPAGPGQPGWSVRFVTPTPTRDGATLRLRTVRPGLVSVRLFDVRGALVRTVEEGVWAAGERIVRWDGRNDRGVPVPSGVYFFRVDAADGVLTRKIAVLR